MKVRKQNQAEIVIVEATAWLLVLGIVYILAKILL